MKTKFSGPILTFKKAVSNEAEILSEIVCPNIKTVEIVGSELISPLLSLYPLVSQMLNGGFLGHWSWSCPVCQTSRIRKKYVGLIMVR